MASGARFFAWAAPARGVGVIGDHTWVTTYDSESNKYNGIEAILTAKAHFWYCWGIFRPTGTALCNSLGDLNEAICLVRPDAACHLEFAARGTIFHYGTNGVCHQLANQVLYATGTATGAPLTVSSARAYWASTFRYGTYGVPEATWESKRDTCRIRRRQTPRQPKGGETMARDSDQFETRARTLLRDDPKLLSDLLALRAEAQKLSSPARQKAIEPTAKELNSDNQRMLDRAAMLLGPDKFERIFEFSPTELVELVDDKILRAEQRSAIRQESPPPGFSPPIYRVRISKTPPTVTLKHLALALSEEHELSRKQTEAILGDLVVRVTKHLKKGKRIRILGLGVLQVRKRAARMGRNPATGEAIHIKATKKVAFRPAKDLKDAI